MEVMNLASTTISSREFNQDTSRAKKAANDGPVFITHRGKPAHVLIRFDEYRRLRGGQPKIADLLAMPGIDEIELELPAPRDLPKPADLS